MHYTMSKTQSTMHSALHVIVSVEMEHLLNVIDHIQLHDLAGNTNQDYGEIFGQIHTHVQKIMVLP